MFLMENFIIKDQLENQEQDGRSSPGGKRHRSQECEDGGDEQKIEKNEGVFWGELGPGRGCNAVDGMKWNLAWMLGE